jgi:hypothetical protein
VRRGVPPTPEGHDVQPDQIREALRQVWNKVASETAPAGNAPNTEIHEAATAALATIANRQNDLATVCSATVAGVGVATGNATFQAYVGVNAWLGQLSRLAVTLPSG